MQLQRRPGEDRCREAYAEFRRIFSGNLKRLRERAGVKVYWVAQQFGVEASTWGRWETGDRFPSPEMLVALALFFHVSPHYLFTPHEPKRLASGRSRRSAPYNA